MLSAVPALFKQSVYRLSAMSGTTYIGKGAMRRRECLPDWGWVLSITQRSSLYPVDWGGSNWDMSFLLAASCISIDQL